MNGNNEKITAAEEAARKTDQLNRAASLRVYMDHKRKARSNEIEKNNIKSLA